MQGRTPEFDDITRRSHTPVCQGDVLDDDGKVMHQLVLTGGSVVSDRMAAIRTSFDVDIVDQNKDIDYEGLLFGKRIQLYRGALTSPKADTRAVFYGTTTSWVPSGTSTGELNGVKIDTDGSIVLGP